MHQKKIFALFATSFLNVVLFLSAILFSSGINSVATTISTDTLSKSSVKNIQAPLKISSSVYEADFMQILCVNDENAEDKKEDKSNSYTAKAHGSILTSNSGRYFYSDPTVKPSVLRQLQTVVLIS